MSHKMINKPAVVGVGTHHDDQKNRRGFAFSAPPGGGGGASACAAARRFCLSARALCDARALDLARTWESVAFARRPPLSAKARSTADCADADSATRGHAGARPVRTRGLCVGRQGESVRICVCQRQL